jgi:hypothetical protein
VGNEVSIRKMLNKHGHNGSHAKNGSVSGQMILYAVFRFCLSFNKNDVMCNPV